MEKISIFGNLMVSEEVNSLVEMTGNMMEHILMRFISISAPNCLFSISAQRSDPFCTQRSALKPIFQNRSALKDPPPYFVLLVTC